MSLSRRLARAEASVGVSPARVARHRAMLRELYAITSRLDGTPLPDDAALQADAERLAATGKSPGQCWLEAMHDAWEEAHR